MRTRNGVLLGVLLAVAVGGCGKAGAGTGVATAGGTAHPSSSASAPRLSEQDRALLFARCMRANGVPNFPDPAFDGKGGVSLDLPAGVDRAKVEAAQQKCKQYAPDGGVRPTPDPKRVEQARQYAKCMRANGVPNFPDPNPDGGIAIDGDKLDPNSPAVKAADEKCRPLMGAPGGTVTGNGGGQAGTSGSKG